MVAPGFAKYNSRTPMPLSLPGDKTLMADTARELLKRGLPIAARLAKLGVQQD